MEKADLDLERKVSEIKDKLSSLKKGDNILIKESDSYFLLKYRESSVQFLEKSEAFITQRTNGFSWKYNIDKAEKFPDSLGEIDIEGNHLLKFDYNKNFDTFFPSSDNRSVLFSFDEKAENLLEIKTSNQDILEEISQIVPPIYFENVIVPFVKETSTKYKMPYWKTKNNNKRNKIRIKFYDELKKIEQGKPAYIGSKEEVWLVTRCSPEESSIYTNIYNNPLFCTNSLLNGTDFRFFQGYEDYKNFCSIKEKPFVFPSIGLRENCYINLMRGKPQMITSNLDDALEHFSKTDFFEFKSVVEEYFKSVNN